MRGVKLPVGVSAFPDEIYAAPKSWAEKAYVNLIHYNKLPKGGHFAGLGTAGVVHRRASRDVPSPSQIGLKAWRQRMRLALPPCRKSERMLRCECFDLYQRPC